MSPAANLVNSLLDRIRSGDDRWDELYGALYADLKRSAKVQLGKQPHMTMSPTLLVNETWLRFNHSKLEANDRQHLIGLFVRAMRFVLVDEIRRNLTQRRDSGVKAQDPELLKNESMESALLDNNHGRILAIHDALQDLEKIDPRLSQLVSMRFFGGMTEREIADAMGVNSRTVTRDWVRARTVLLTLLDDDAR